MFTLPLALALVIGAVVGLVLALITFVVWPYLFQFEVYQLPVWYVLGTVPLLAGYTAWAYLSGYGDTALALWAIVLVAGAFTIATYAFHWWRDERARPPANEEASQ